MNKILRPITEDGNTGYDQFNQLYCLHDQIGQFFLKKNEGDHVKANDEILRLQIVRIEVITSALVLIETSRPGLLIGRRGETVEQLKEFLGKSIHIKECKENIVDFMFVYDEFDYNYDYELTDEENSVDS